MPVESNNNSETTVQTSDSSELSPNCDSNPNSSGVQITALNQSRRSAFSPYRPSTVLTNLQRGNIQTQTPTNLPERSVHQLAAMGELFVQHLDENVVQDRDENGFTPLHWAASYGQLSTVKLLLSKGADVNAKGKREETPLLLTAANGHLHVLKELIANSALINQTDEEGNSALMFAAYGNHALCANELMKAGASVSLINSNLDTVLSIAIQRKSRQAQSIIEKNILQMI